MRFEALWIDGWMNPPAAAERVLQFGGGSPSRDLAKCGNYDQIQKLAYRGRLKEALHLLGLLAERTSAPPQGAFVCLLRVCARRKALAEGKQVHALILKTKFDANVFLSNLLIEMYAACGSAADALRVFAAMRQRNVFSWTAIITAYAKSKHHKEAVILFKQMSQARIEPDEVVCVVALNACTNIAALEQGRRLHSLIVKKGFHSNVIVQNALINMYAKCGCLKDAHKLFDDMKEQRDVISWNAMIAGYAQGGLGNEALDLYEQMKHVGLEPNNVTLVLLLKACAGISALQQGKQLHALIVQKGLESQPIVQTTLVDMYSKCGCLKNARELFDNMTQRNLIAWSAMIAGYAQEGLGKEALDLFQQMKDESFQPDVVTFTSVLSACSHSGFVAEGCHIFESMSKDHSVTPTVEHYACMVDLLGRAGCLSDAEDLILRMPFAPGNTVWHSLLGAARKHGNLEIGRRAFERIVKLEPENATPYLVLSDIYLAAGKMDEVAQVRKEMNEKCETSVKV